MSSAPQTSPPSKKEYRAGLRAWAKAHGQKYGVNGNSPSDKIEKAKREKQAEDHPPAAPEAKQSVLPLLESLRLAKYYPKLVEEGYEDMLYLAEVTLQDLRAMGMKKGHAKTLLRNISTSGEPLLDKGSASVGEPSLEKQSPLGEEPDRSVHRVQKWLQGDQDLYIQSDLTAILEKLNVCTSDDLFYLNSKEEGVILNAMKKPECRRWRAHRAVKLASALTPLVPKLASASTVEDWLRVIVPASVNAAGAKRARMWMKEHGYLDSKLSDVLNMDLKERSSLAASIGTPSALARVRVGMRFNYNYKYEVETFLMRGSECCEDTYYYELEQYGDAPHYEVQGTSSECYGSLDECNYAARLKFGQLSEAHFKRFRERYPKKPPPNMERCLEISETGEHKYKFHYDPDPEDLEYTYLSYTVLVSVQMALCDDSKGDGGGSANAAGAASAASATTDTNTSGESSSSAMTMAWGEIQRWIDPFAPPYSNGKAAGLRVGLENGTKTELDLHYKNIDEDGMRELAKVLPQCKALSMLDLSENQIRASGMVELANVLPQCVISYLDISGNNIGDSGASALINMLPQSALTYLVIGAAMRQQLGAIVIDKIRRLRSAPVLNRNGDQILIILR